MFRTAASYRVNGQHGPDLKVANGNVINRRDPSISSKTSSSARFHSGLRRFSGLRRRGPPSTGWTGAPWGAGRGGLRFLCCPGLGRLEPFHLVQRRPAGAAGQFVPAACGQFQRPATARSRSRWQSWSGRASAVLQGRVIAYNATAAAFETLSDPNPPEDGILTSLSHKSRVRALRPGPLCPQHQRQGPVRQAGRQRTDLGLGLAIEAEDRRSPCPATSRSRCRGSGTPEIGVRSSAPLGFLASAPVRGRPRRAGGDHRAGRRTAFGRAQ